MTNTPKTKVPTIIVDEKHYSDKLYLSLLKTQIFHSEQRSKVDQENNSNKMHSKKKRKMLESAQEVQRNVRFDISPVHMHSENQRHNLNLSQCTETSFSRKLDFTNLAPNKFNIFDANVKLEDLEFSSENTKPSFKKLINFDMEDKEYTSNFLVQKKIPKSPCKVLDAPNLKDDFYLHLLDWSKDDLLAVGLDKSLYIWEGKNSNVSLIDTLAEEQYTSVCWMNNENLLMVGTTSGKINIWDMQKLAIVKTYSNHSERVGVISRKNTDVNCFSSGSQDRSLVHYDIRTNTPTSTFTGHLQEVCGLKWSPDDRRLASGGNDNKLLIWNINKSTPEKKLTAHRSAVKALDWSPHKFGFLMSGGGTQDRTIKIWNTNTMTLVDSIDTSSQVCNIAFSKNSHEFVTTHGYSDNLILLWDSDKMDVKATLKGHKDRVIYLSVGPDQQKIVTGAGDETIRFWDVFIPDKSLKDSSCKNLEMKSLNIR